MSRNTKRDRYAAYDKDRLTENGYVYGNTVRKLEPVRRERTEGRARKQPSPGVLKNRARARYMSMGYVTFLAAALCAAAFVLVNYVQLQTELTNLTKSLADKKVELNNIRMANDEEYNRIVNSVDLEEIKRIAMGELGMIYAQEGQIVTYEGKSHDYMRQVTDGSYQR